MSDTHDTEHPRDDAPVQACGHPWSAVVQLDPETVDCGACLDEGRRGQAREHEQGEA